MMWARVLPEKLYACHDERANLLLSNLMLIYVLTVTPVADAIMDGVMASSEVYTDLALAQAAALRVLADTVLGANDGLSEELRLEAQRLERPGAMITAARIDQLVDRARDADQQCPDVAIGVEWAAGREWDEFTAPVPYLQSLLRRKATVVAPVRPGNAKVFGLEVGRRPRLALAFSDTTATSGNNHVVAFPVVAADYELTELRAYFANALRMTTMLPKGTPFIVEAIEQDMGADAIYPLVVAIAGRRFDDPWVGLEIWAD